MSKLEEVLKTPEDSDTGYFVEVDLKNPDKLEKETKSFPFAPQNKAIPKDKYNEYMKKMKPNNYTKAKKLLSYWTNDKNYLYQYRILKFYVRYGM